MPRFIIVNESETRQKNYGKAMKGFENFMRFNHAIIMLDECDLVSAKFE